MKSPSDCTATELNAFIALVREAGEVAANGLPNRVRAAERLFFLLDESYALLGISALKHPSPGYRAKVFSHAAAQSTPDEFPFEVGWVVVAPQYRGLGLSRPLVSMLLSYQPPSFVFATTRADNHFMQRTLLRLGFKREGHTYRSERGDYDLVLLTRKGHDSKRNA